MKEIPLTQGLFALIDDEDFDMVNKFKWCASRNYNKFYAIRASSRKDGHRTSVLMHRLLLGVSKPRVIIDHVDGNGLNNQRANLRVCTHSDNCMNRKAPKNNTSGAKGVNWNKKRGVWRAEIMAKGKRFHLGYFDDISLAIKAYSDAAKKHHGEFSIISNTK